MKTVLTMQESLEREKSLILRQDFSECTILAAAHNRNCIEALKRQIPVEFEHMLVTPEWFAFKIIQCMCPTCGNCWDTFCDREKRCPECGQALKW